MASSKFLLATAMLFWMVLRSVSSRSILSQKMDELRSWRHKREDYGECEYEVARLDTTLNSNQELIRLIINGQRTNEFKLINCRAVDAPCGDSSAYREGRQRRCRQTYYDNSELVTLGITSNRPEQRLPVDLPSGCKCVDPEAV